MDPNCTWEWSLTRALAQLVLFLSQEEEQAGTVLGQAQLKLELELNFTSFKICCIKLVKLVKLWLLGGAKIKDQTNVSIILQISP